MLGAHACQHDMDCGIALTEYSSSFFLGVLFNFTDYDSGSVKCAYYIKVNCNLCCSPSGVGVRHRSDLLVKSV